MATAYVKLWTKALWGWLCAGIFALALLFSLFKIVHIIGWLFFIIAMIGLGVLASVAIIKGEPWSWPSAQG